MAFVILATRVRPAATLPGGHLVRLVADSRWLQIPLQVCLLCCYTAGTIMPLVSTAAYSQVHPCT